MTATRLIRHMALCVAVMLLTSACETIPHESKSVAVSTSTTHNSHVAMITPIPRCDAFLSNIAMAEQKTAQHPAPITIANGY